LVGQCLLTLSTETEYTVPTSEDNYTTNKQYNNSKVQKNHQNTPRPLLSGDNRLDMK